MKLHYKKIVLLGGVSSMMINLSANNDINIKFMGLDPLWRKREEKSLIIHEYHSLSTPPFARAKNRIKKYINRKPDGRIFLNEIVRNELGFNDKVPYICRDMGVDNCFFANGVSSSTYDIVYCGSYF